MRPSHEIIRQWINEVGERYRANTATTEGSGIYCYDEQHIRIKGIRHYRLTLIDALTGEIINEKIVRNLTWDNIKDFLLISLKGKKVLAIVSDGNPQYDSILKEITKELNLQEEILHQLCVFHALKNFSKAIHNAIRDIKKRKLGHTTNYKNMKNTMKLVFNLDNKKAVEKYLERLPENHQKAFLRVINDDEKTLKEKARRLFDYIYRWHLNYHPYISNEVQWIHKHWDNLTLFYEHPQIPKTNNAVEHHFANTNPKLVKRTFKSPQSLESYLFVIAAHNNERLSLKT